VRAVVDTNVLVRAVIRPQGTVGPILTRLRERAYVLITSEELLAELVDVLGRPHIRLKYHLTDEDVTTILVLLQLRGETVSPGRRIYACRDPKDDKVLEAAVAGNVDVIVTGDQDLLVLDPFEGMAIMTPARFLALLDQSREA
jgi:putative PIN family toxin of toxin-antitoxin system